MKSDNYSGVATNDELKNSSGWIIMQLKMDAWGFEEKIL
jgi:hypothetical protein